MTGSLSSAELAATLWEGVLEESRQRIGEINWDKWAEPMGRSARTSPQEVERRKLTVAFEPLVHLGRLDGRFTPKVDGIVVTQGEWGATLLTRPQRLRFAGSSTDDAGFTDWNLAFLGLAVANGMEAAPSVREQLAESAEPRVTSVVSGVYEGPSWEGLPWGVLEGASGDVVVQTATKETAQLVADVIAARALGTLMQVLEGVTEEGIE
jgi:hypothetical protein